MRISVVASKIEYDAKGFVTATYKALRQQMIAAAAEFVHEAAPAVPIDTGMARGSFLNILQLLDKNTSEDGKDYGKYARSIPDGIPDIAKRRQRNGYYIRYYHSDGNDYQKQPKTAKKFTTSFGQIIKRDGDKLVFNYQIDVVHYNIMDEFNPHGSSWQSIRKGREAFMNKMKQFKPVGVKKYLLVSTQTNANSGDGSPKTLRNQKTVK
jgi:hypothetical protein